jgi:hypothetical protein
MEKVYRLLPWLNSAQAVDYLQSLTYTDLGIRELIALCDTCHCNAYVNCDGLEAEISEFSELIGHIRLSGHYAIASLNKIPIHEWDSPGERLLYLSGLNTVCGNAQIEDVLNSELREEQGSWDVVLDNYSRGLPVQFNRQELELLAATMNASASRPTSELEYLRQQLGQERVTHEATEADPRPSHLLAIAALLELLKAPVEYPRPQGMNQTAIKSEILEKFPWRGLSDRNLEAIFAAANKAKAGAE